MSAKYKGGGGGAATAIVETGGPTTLTIGAVADGEFLVRAGSTIDGVAGTSGPPTGVAGGDLGGNYPNPKVAAVTTGVTSLVVGTVTDGEFLKRVGATLVSAVPPAAGAASGDLTGTYPGPTVANDAVTNAKLRNSAAVSVIGRSANSTGDPADIAASANGHYLKRAADAVAFGAIAAADLPAASGSAQGAMSAADFTKLATYTAPSRTILGSAAQTITATLVGSPRRIRITARVKNASVVSENVTLLVNGAATNVTMQLWSAVGGASGGAAGYMATVGVGVTATFEMDMYIAAGAGALERLGSGSASCNNGSGLISWTFSFRYNDTSTTITSVALDAGVALGFATNSEIDIEEIA